MSFFQLIPDWQTIKFLLVSGWDDFVSTEFDQLGYSSVDLALYLGAFITVAILLRLLFPRIMFFLFGRNPNKYSQKVSGHLISRKYKRGFWAGFIFLLPRLLISVPLVAI